MGECCDSSDFSSLHIMGTLSMSFFAEDLPGLVEGCVVLSWALEATHSLVSQYIIHFLELHMCLAVMILLCSDDNDLIFCLVIHCVQLLCL
jgi:hypothetical protein